MRVAQDKKEKVGRKEMHKKDKWTLFEGPDLLRGEQRPFCPTFWRRAQCRVAQCHGRAGWEYCREEEAFCQHNIRCFRPILTGRGRQEDKRPTKCGGGGIFCRKERGGKGLKLSILGDWCSFVYLQLAPVSPLFAHS